MADYARICGVDEAGRGPLAGPVVAAAVVLPYDYQNPKIKDSKQLSAKKREQLVEIIRADAIACAVIAVGPRRIDKLNILRATLLAMKLAVEKVKGFADIVLIDGNQRIDTELPQRTVIGGDALHVQISAASILAKVWRDRLMVDLSKKYPGYGFEKHAGYPTVTHKEAILRQGPSPVHRLTFAGVR